MRSRARTRRCLPRSRGGAASCGAGSSSTTTSGASARSGGPALAQTRGEAARRSVWNAEWDPADVAAVGATGVLLHRAARDRLRIDLAALEAADALEDGELLPGDLRGFHVHKDALED